MDMGAELPIPAGEQASTAKLAFDPTRLLLPAEVIEIIDRTLACEVRVRVAIETQSSDVKRR